MERERLLIELSLLALTFYITSCESASQSSPIVVKPYSGVRVRNDSLLKVFYCYDTVAVIEYGRKRELYNCDLIETVERTDRDKVLLNLTKIDRNPTRLSLRLMNQLMASCTMVPRAPGVHLVKKVIVDRLIYPGTIWCGRGDEAKTYQDLGELESVDRCCRNHDLCPVKVLAGRTEYGIKNTEVGTISHCDCDTQMRNCLKSLKETTADIIGNLLFNVVDLGCLEGTPPNLTYRKTEKRY